MKESVEEKEREYLLPTSYYEALNEIYKSDNGTFKMPTDYSECPISEYIAAEDLTLKEKVFPNSKNIPKIILYLEKAQKYGQELLDDEDMLKDYLEYIGIEEYNLNIWKTFIEILIIDSIFQQSKLQLEKEEYLAGLWNLRLAWKSYDNLIDREIDLNGKYKKLNIELIQNLKYSIGLFYYQISILPKSHKLLNIISYLSGFEYDYNLGLKYMFDVFNSSSCSMKKNQCGLFLLEVYLEKPNGLKSDKKLLEEIKNIMEYFLKYFKDNSLVKYYYSIYLKKNGKFEKSKQILINLINYIEFDLKLKVPPKWIWSLANILISLGEWKLAIKELEKLNSYSFFSTIQLVNACQILGDRKTAIKVLTNFKSKKKSGRYSNIILESLESLESKQFSIHLYTVNLEVLYFRNILNFLSSKKLELIKKQLDQLEQNDILNIDQNEKKKKKKYTNVSILTLQGIILKLLLKHSESKILFKRVIDIYKSNKKDLSNDIHWIVISYCELGDILFYQKKYKESKEMFEMANSFSIYDWEENGFVFIRIKSSLIKLNDFNDEKEPEIVNPQQIRGVKKLSLLNLNFMKFGDDDHFESQIDQNLNDDQVEIEKTNSDSDSNSNPNPNSNSNDEN
eukprot:gene10451-2973_t